MSTTRASVFVPHDLDQPVPGTPGGPLDGLTAVIKDMYDIAGTKTGAGCPEWLAVQKPAAKHAAAVANLLGAGATVVGKTICDELFYSVTGINAHYGMPVNPRAPGRIPGGSSAGSAATVAAGIADIGLGSDTGGSVRIPAALNGVWGLRTSTGRVDAAGEMAMAPSFDAAGWFTAGPGLLRKVGQVLLEGQAARAPLVRLLIAEDAFAEADGPVAGLVRKTLDRMIELPAQRETVKLAAGSDGGLDSWRETFRLIQARETWATFKEFIERENPKLGPGVRQRFEIARAVTAQQEKAERAKRETILARIHGLVTPGTIVALPSAPCIAPLATSTMDEFEHYRLRVMRLVVTAGIAGLPQLNVPIGTVDGCPVGLGLIGWRNGDEALLDLAVRLGGYCGQVG
jgi:amidase